MEENKVDSYLIAIENFLKAPQNLHKHNSILKFFQITFSDSQEQLIKIVEEKLSSKRIFFVRHAQADHNTFMGWLGQKFSFERYTDPPITPTGQEQCEKLKKQLDEELNKVQIDIVYLSPLSRVIQTFDIIQKSTIFSSTVKYILTDLIREKLKTNNQVGKKLNELKETQKEKSYLKYDYLTKDEWWENTGNLKIEKEHEEDLNSRLILFFIWIALTEDKNIFIISHSYIYKWIYDFKQKSKNAKYFELDYKILVNKIKNFKFF